MSFDLLDAIVRDIPGAIGYRPRQVEESKADGRVPNTSF